MTIILRVSDGLGNQLFQYAAGRRLAEAKQVPLKLDTRWFNRSSLRTYKLPHYNIMAEMASPAEIARFTTRNLQSKAWRYLHRRLLPHPLRRYYKEGKKFHYDPHFDRLPDDVYLQGWLQHEDYFKPIAAIIRRELMLCTALDSANLAMADQIRGIESVSLHIRRGDYLEPQIRATFGLMSLDYYARAVQQVSQRVAQPHFFIFSNDLEWAKANLRIDFPVTFVDINTEEQDYADLYLMSQCKHHIIANSTFSWWGAWLGEHPSQVVYAPHQWRVNPKLNAHNTIPARWHLI
ncbi:MAG: alpha-1,2-fucosyltransferase [Burkholderiales bacterium]|nr:alpha-1,2-fucosyltransferase [Anaerolineae bacterium]